MTIKQIKKIIDEVTESDGYVSDQTREIIENITEQIEQVIDEVTKADGYVSDQTREIIEKIRE